jgi:V/A-type H+-transporting ATPase subunit C
MALRIGLKKTNYAYAVARVQAKRAKLIPRGEYEKLLKMDLSEITRYIEESSYRSDVDELSARFSGLDLLEAALAVNEERTNAAVRRMVDGEGGELVALYLARHLVEDIKTVLRGKNAGATRDELLRELLLEDLDTYGIFQPLLADDVKTPDDVTKALMRQGGVAAQWARVMETVPAESGPAAYEDALGKAYYHMLVSQLEDSKQRGSAQMLLFVRREIDARNLANAARWVHNQQTDDFSLYVIPGGQHVKVGDVMRLARASDLAGFKDIVVELGLPEAIVNAIAEAQAQARLAPFQTALKHWHLGELDRLGHANPLSIIPILVFLARKDQEVVTLRALARGKSAGLSEERLKELIQ